MTRPGATCDVPVSSIDFFPTLLEIAGVQAKNKIDGRSLVPLLRQAGSLQRDALYWHYPHYWSGNRLPPFGMVRAGDWKLIEFYEDMRVELYNLRDDLGETRDLAQAKPAKAAALCERLHNWRKSVAAQMPTPNPDYRPGKAKKNPQRNDQALWLRAAED